jgi:hypothetical protein
MRRLHCQTLPQPQRLPLKATQQSLLPKPKQRSRPRRFHTDMRIEPGHVPGFFVPGFFVPGFFVSASNQPQSRM